MNVNFFLFFNLTFFWRKFYTILWDDDDDDEGNEDDDEDDGEEEGGDDDDDVDDAKVKILIPIKFLSMCSRRGITWGFLLVRVTPANVSGRAASPNRNTWLLSELLCSRDSWYNRGVVHSD